MFPFGIFLSRERAAEIHREKVDYDLGWDRVKFPVFEGGGGEYFLIECDSTKDSYGMILFYSIKDVEFNRIISYFDSLYTLFLTIYECSIDDISRYDNGSFDCDDDVYFEFAGREI